MLQPSGQVIKGMVSGAPSDWGAWEKAARPPQVYDPPQTATTCVRKCLYQWWRSTCCCAAPACRFCICKPCCQQSLGRITDSAGPDGWILKMLNTGTNANCPEMLKGIWWLKDNVAAEGLITFHDADWDREKLGLKIAKYNWTVDAYNVWGAVLSANFWLRGGNHLFEFSPNGKWIHISVINPGSDWIYVIQPGDVFKRPDGSVLDVSPGNDLMRVSYETLDTNSTVSYQYLMRRVAYLGPDGDLVKTPVYEQLVEAAKQSPHSFCGQFGCFDVGQFGLHDIENTQAFTYAGPPPAQVTMGDQSPLLAQ